MQDYQKINDNDPFNCVGVTTAATVQLSVPLITAIGGILLLGETLTLRLAIAAIAILDGIALVALNKPSRSRLSGRRKRA